MGRRGAQAELERFLASQAEGQIKSESRIREIAVLAIRSGAAYALGDERPEDVVLVEHLLVLAGFWISKQGAPTGRSGEQVELERFLVSQAESKINAGSMIAKIAEQAIGFGDAYRKAGN